MFRDPSGQNSFQEVNCKYVTPLGLTVFFLFKLMCFCGGWGWECHLSSLHLNSAKLTLSRAEFAMGIKGREMGTKDWNGREMSVKGMGRWLGTACTHRGGQENPTKRLLLLHNFALSWPCWLQNGQVFTVLSWCSYPYLSLGAKSLIVNIVCSPFLEDKSPAGTWLSQNGIQVFRKAQHRRISYQL